MALSNEDKKDVAGAFGKKAANAVSKATRDRAFEKKHPVVMTPSGAFTLGKGGQYNRAKSSALKSKTDDKKVEHFKAIKEHVSGGKKSGGFNDPFWYSKK